MKNKRISVFGNMITLPDSPDHAGIVNALQKMKDSGRIDDFQIVDTHIHHRDNIDMIDTLSSFSPNIIIYGMTNAMASQWPTKVKHYFKDAIQVQAMWDYRPEYMQYDGLWDIWRESGPALDMIGMSNKNQAAWWEKDFGTPVMYWPQACDIRELEYSDEYNVDCVFVGDRIMAEPYNVRALLIDDISAELEKRGMKLTWINRAGGDSDPERRKIWQDIGKIYNSAKTVLDVSHFWDADGYCSSRSFFAPGLGGCTITKRFPGCEELFPDGTKKYFDTPEEAADLIRYYVDNEVERNNIKKLGKEHANKFHTYEVRFNQLFERLNI